MPTNPLDYLTQPLLPKAAIKPTQDLIDDPAGDYGEWEARARGFGAGALDGLRDLTSPLNLGSFAVAPGLSGAIRAGKATPALGGLVKSLQGAADAWEAPSSLRAAAQPLTRPYDPKPGGVLYEVLERAGLKSGTGQTLTPGESRLLEQFTPKPRF